MVLFFHSCNSLKILRGVSGDKQFLPNCFQYPLVARWFFVIAREVKIGFYRAWNLCHIPHLISNKTWRSAISWGPWLISWALKHSLHRFFVSNSKLNYCIEHSGGTGDCCLGAAFCTANLFHSLLQHLSVAGEKKPQASLNKFSY